MGVGRQHRGEIVEALAVRAEVAALARVLRIAAGAVAVELREQHRDVLGAAEAGIAALAVEHRVAPLPRCAKQQRVGHGQRIADRVTEQSDRAIEIAQDGVDGHLDDMMTRVAVPGHQRAELELVSISGAERH